jgi:hypothetical protein
MLRVCGRRVLTIFEIGTTLQAVEIDSKLNKSVNAVIVANDSVFVLMVTYSDIKLSSLIVYLEERRTAIAISTCLVR